MDFHTGLQIEYYGGPLDGKRERFGGGVETLSGTMRDTNGLPVTYVYRHELVKRGGNVVSVKGVFAGMRRIR